MLKHDKVVKLVGGGRFFLKAKGRFDLSSYKTCGKTRTSSSLYNFISLCKRKERLVSAPELWPLHAQLQSCACVTKRHHVWHGAKRQAYGAILTQSGNNC